jgi:hypothetical protein
LRNEAHHDAKPDDGRQANQIDPKGHSFAGLLAIRFLLLFDALGCSIQKVLSNRPMTSGPPPPRLSPFHPPASFIEAALMQIGVGF